MTRVIAFLSLCVLVSCTLGCGEAGPKTYPVTGKVTIGGEPADGLQITFEPADNTMEIASGNVGADGTYTLYTGVSGKPGAMPGKYTVLLTDPSDESYMDEGPAPGLDETTEDPTAGGAGGRVPQEYQDNPKQVEVTAGDNKIDIEI